METVYYKLVSDIPAVELSVYQPLLKLFPVWIMAVTHLPEWSSLCCYLCLAVRRVKKHHYQPTVSRNVGAGLNVSGNAAKSCKESVYRQTLQFCASLVLLFGKGSRCAKGNGGIPNRGIKNLSRPVGSVFGFTLTCFAFKFPWLKDPCSSSMSKMTGFVHPC